MTTIDLGKVAVVPKGEYDAETQYEVLDAVSYQGSSYLAIEDSLGIVPTNPEYWMILSQKGDPAMINGQPSVTLVSGKNIEIVNDGAGNLTIGVKDTGSLSVGSIQVSYNMGGGN